MPVIMEGVVRAVFAFVVLLVLVRLMGKQSYTQLTFFDYVSGVAIGVMGALMAAAVNINVWAVFSALLTFVALLILNGFLVLESRPLRKLLRGEPVVVVHNGKILEGISTELIVDGRVVEQNLMQNKLSAGWLEDQLRMQGIYNISEVSYASLGTDGKLFIDKKQDTLDNVTDVSDKET